MDALKLAGTNGIWAERLEHCIFDPPGKNDFYNFYISQRECAEGTRGHRRGNPGCSG